jgi:hypothetical protein
MGEIVLCEGCNKYHGAVNIELECLRGRLRAARSVIARRVHGVSPAEFEANRKQSDYFRRTRVK